MEEAEQKSSDLILSLCTPFTLVTYNFKSKASWEKSPSLCTHSQITMFSQTDYPLRKPGHLCTPGNSEHWMLPFWAGGVPPPLYINRNIYHSISPYSSQCLPLSAEMEMSRQLITIYLFTLEALCASICLSLQAKEMHELRSTCTLQRTESVRIHPKMLQKNHRMLKKKKRHNFSIRKQPKENVKGL